MQVIVAAFLVLAIGAGAAAQSSTPQGNPGAEAQGTQPVTPKLSPPQPEPPTLSTPPKKAKIIWTNDNLDQLGFGSRWTPGGGPPPSTVIPGATEPNADVKEPTEKDKEKAKETELVKRAKNLNAYREKLGPLRADLAQLDAKIKELREQLRNPIEGSNAIDLRHAPVIMRPTDQLKELELKRQETQQKISDIEDEARRNGFSLAELR
jgi:hypothetical protein